MTYIWLVCGDGGWEPDPVVSIWSTESGAEAEAERLGDRASGTYNTGRAIIHKVAIDTPCNIEAQDPLNG